MDDAYEKQVLEQVKDLNAVIEKVKTLDFVDTDNTFLLGSFMGGATVATAAVTHSDDIRTIWNTAGVTDMSGTFYNCSSLTSLDLSRWNTAGVTDMSFMFNNCGSLTSLDLSSWEAGKVKDMSHIFFDCGKLTSVYVGSGWNTDNVSSSGKMFMQCKNLTGGEGTSYDDAYTDKAYARIDGGAANPGCFTGAGQ